MNRKSLQFLRVALFVLALLTCGCDVRTVSENQQAEEPATTGRGGFDQLLEDCSSTRPEAARQMIEAAIRREGATPLVDGNEVMFLFEQTLEAEAPRVLGDFNEWAAEDGPFAGAGGMTRVGNTRWYALRTQVLPDARFEYQIAVGMQRFRDPRNSNEVETFGSKHSEFRMPSARTGIGVDQQVALRGRVESCGFDSKVRDNSRELQIYLPPDTGGDPLPVLYVLDGDSWLDQARLALIIDRMIAQEKLKPLIAVFVPPVNRGLEYGGYSKFREMMTAEMFPWIKERYSISDDRAILGCSRSGLAALDLAFQHADAIEHVLVIAPSIRPINFLEELAAADKRDFAVTVQQCQYDLQELQVQAEELHQILDDKRYDVTYLTAPIAHSYNGWQHYVDEVLLTWPAIGK